MSSAAASGDIEEGPPKIHGQGSDIPTEGISGKFSGPFFQGIAKRKRMGRDAKILVTARNAETGVVRELNEIHLRSYNAAIYFHNRYR